MLSNITEAKTYETEKAKLLAEKRGLRLTLDTIRYRSTYFFIYGPESVSIIHTGNIGALTILLSRRKNLW